MNFLKFVIYLIFNEIGKTEWWSWPFDVGGDETVDPYADLREQYKTYLGKKLGTSTPYSYNSAFEITQPNVEKAAEDTILGKLKSGVSNVSDYSEATKKYSDAMKASRNETYAEEAQKTKDMYNRLGLVSSTPGLQAQSDLSRKQATEANLFDSELAYKNLDRTLQAQGLDITELNNILGQARTLGQTQRASQEYTQQASESDIARMANEELSYAQLANSLLGNNSPTTTYNPSMIEQLLSYGSDILPYLFLMA